MIFFSILNNTEFPPLPAGKIDVLYNKLAVNKAEHVFFFPFKQYNLAIDYIEYKN